MQRERSVSSQKRHDMPTFLGALLSQKITKSSDNFNGKYIQGSYHRITIPFGDHVYLMINEIKPMKTLHPLNVDPRPLYSFFLSRRALVDFDHHAVR